VDVVAVVVVVVVVVAVVAAVVAVVAWEAVVAWPVVVPWVVVAAWLEVVAWEATFLAKDAVAILEWAVAWLDRSWEFQGEAALLAKVDATLEWPVAAWVAWEVAVACDHLRPTWAVVVARAQ